MIQINIVSRFTEDKNMFFAVLFAVHQLKEQGINDVTVLFIGDILSEALYRSTHTLIDLFDLSDRVNFTKRSIRFADMTEGMKQGYFLNFTIGNFVGFSGIESINNGFKTIFLNLDRSLDDRTVVSASQCNSVDSFIALLKNLSTDKAFTDKLILEDNLSMKQDLHLNATDSSILLSILSPA